ncbi:hypothetical protein HSB1_48170 [Halogranum salarium B-1]|uniref:Uncharacterized protein n=1 Tax=Halogranum salarium B-1 TaxID=1210908 RepID=J2Z8Q2_9EURY|nr:hypothetical protein HSB1_48170 [Halogranum salarium B-1]
MLADWDNIPESEAPKHSLNDERAEGKHDEEVGMGLPSNEGEDSEAHHHG